MKKIDLHNDLLNYLIASSSRTPYDEGLECSIPEMIAGSIYWQVLAAFSLTPTNHSVLAHQFYLFLRLRHCVESIGGKVNFLWAIEDAQQLISDSFLGNSIGDKIDLFRSLQAPPVYISLTWKNENELGGGDNTNIGLKTRGRDLLDVLATTSIAIDLSHASDKLVEEIIEYREMRSYKNPIIVSHTGFRSIHPVLRNIRDTTASYILASGGLIGLSFSRYQLGERPALNLLEHYDHAILFNPELSKVLCLGGDLYHQGDIPSQYRSQNVSFYPELSRASHYAGLDSLPRTFIFENALSYLQRHGYIGS